MRLLIIGNGIAGVMCAKSLRDLDFEGDIEILGRENHLYYPRPNLIEYLAGNITYERLFAFDEDWYGKNRIRCRLGTSVRALFPEDMEVELDHGRREKYDICVLAIGSYSFIPPIKGTDKQGIFTLWTLDDCLEMRDGADKHRRAVVIGGGLLGLEVARALKSRGTEVDVVEFFDRLLPRQLDVQGASVLKTQIENMGIKVHLGLSTEEVLGAGAASGLRFKSGMELKTPMAVIAAGARPNTALASEAGLETEKGILVDDFLCTTSPEIYGIGDAVQHRGKMYGIIPACFAQARTAAHNILGQKKEYSGTIPSNSLKVMGLDVLSVGLVHPEEPDCEEIRTENAALGLYKKIVLRENRIIGAIWMGTKTGAAEITRAVSENKNIKKWKKTIFEKGFDYSIL
jgi:nitrite reductase (NADH) large subunit